ncbi:hypothetical protein Patl1_29437 [Pistacia atlantica]|uniref:Uncharacterized protein n=1 Tax=Pistacia atlantica TaxID=434234 RepID=A0ACC1A7W0_9ROSI|nr:hypothetical protein Patl1_29437 [Pistacia atlantica]
MSVKALGTSLKLTFEGKNQLLYPQTWFFMLVVAICVITQMNYLNKDWDGQSGANIISEICGFVVVLSGTILLHTTKDFERSSSFRGGYSSLSPALSPVSPTLSTRLCSGNGEVMRHDNDAPHPEETCFRRQEMY